MSGKSRRSIWLTPLLFCVSAFSQSGDLRITEPAMSKDGTIVTSEPAVTLTGTLSSTVGDQRILWESSRGFSDLAIVRLADDGHTVLWNSASPIPLRPGINHVRIKALNQPGVTASVNIFYTAQAPAQSPAHARMVFRGKEVTYEVRDGLAVFQSDMILGPASRTSVAPKAKGLRPKALTNAPNFISSTGLWPVVNGVVRVPYAITNASAANTNNINAAIAESNTQLAGIVQWAPATGSDVNFVNFDFDPNNLSGSCESSVGMVGGPQIIGGSINCTTTTILHEMGHALGLYHEQSRADRDTYVNYMEQNIDKPQHGNFDIIASGVGSGLYNYASIMEYGAFQFSRDGVSPVLETIPPGIVLSTSLPEYTTGDLDGIVRLYAHAPSSITVDANPSGLKVVVDGTACTAPCVFANWTVGSQHTLSVPLDAHSQTLQTLGGQNYIFGRWNAGSANVQTVTVTNSLGDGTLLSPSTAPAITNYLASFIPIHPYSMSVAPGGDGTVSASPPPSSLIINGVSTKYFQDRQLVTLKATPNNGLFFYDWYPSPFFNLYSNPYTFPVTEDFGSTTANIVSDAVTTITAASPDIGAEGTFPGFAIGVTDGNGNVTTAYTPANFDATVNGSGFGAGKTVTFSTAAAQSPVTTNISYLFNSWSGAGTPNSDSLSVVVPAAGRSKSTANFTPSFRSIVLPSLYCEPVPGNNQLMVTASPAGTNSIGTDGNLDAFFNVGTVDFTAAVATSGLNFVGWSQDLSAGGATNPLPFSLAGQIIGTANFNVSDVTVPLAITSVSPTPTVTEGAADLTVVGTGFTIDPTVTLTYYVNPSTGFFSYRPSTLTSSTQLTIHLQTGDIYTAGYYQIAVLNVTASGCNPGAFITFPVANSAGPPVLAIAKSHVGNFGPGQQNAQYTILVSNTGTGSTVDIVTVAERVPSGETLVSMSGSGWSCILTTCAQQNSLAPGMSYGAITVAVNVAADATSPQVNTATVSGGGAPFAIATDSTIIAGVPNSVTPNAGTTPQTGAIHMAFAPLSVTVSDAGNNLLPNVNVTFTAPASGASGLFSNAAATITVATNGSGVASASFTANGTAGGPYTVTAVVAGVITQASFSLTNTSQAPSVTLSIGSLNFGSVIIASTSASKTVRLTSSGTSSLALTGIAASGDYAETNKCPKSLAPAASCTITVTFMPSAAGTVAGALTIRDNASNSPQLVSLTGVGVNTVSVSPPSLAFGTVTVGLTSKSQTLKVTNNSTSAVSVSVAASAAFASLPTGTAPCGASLAAKASCTVGVTFTPQQNGSINGSLVVAGAFATQLATLTGTGTGSGAPALTFSPASLTFANQETGVTSAGRTVTVTNGGVGSVNVLALTASADFAAVGNGSKPCGGALPAKAKCTMSVTFTPSASGSIKGSVALANSSSVHPLILDLAGTGVLPVTLKPSSLIFAAQTVGTTSAPQIVTLTNNQSVALNLLSVIASGDYTFASGGTAPCGTTVAANGTCTFQVTFTPTVTGTINGAATVTNNASGSPQVVKLSGSGE
jgi:hypothetical protein